MLLSLICLIVVSNTIVNSDPYLRDSLNVRFIGQYNTEGYTYNVFVRGSYAYLADYDGGLRIIDISNPYAPFEAGFCDSTANSMIVTVEGNHAYVGGRYQCLDIVNIQNPAAPFVEGVYMMPTGNGVFNIVIVDTIAFCLSSNYCPSPQSLRAINISQPSSPTLIDSCLAGYGTGLRQGLVIDGDYAFAISYSPSKLIIIDISDINNMHEIASCSLSWTMGRDIYKVDTLIYIANASGGVVIASVADPYSPQVIGQFSMPGLPLGIDINSNLAYVSEWDSCLRVLDISNPLQIQEVGFHDIPSRAYDVFYQTPYIYVAVTTEGLLIYEYLATGIKNFPKHSTPVYFKLLQNPVNRDILEIQFHNLPYTEYSFRLYDASGRMRRIYNDFHFNNGSNVLRLPLNAMPGGIYFLTFCHHNRTVQIEKLIKPD